MVSLNSRGGHGPAFPIPKNCFRCGAEFQDFSDRGLARICGRCRKPKAQPARSGTELLGQPLTAREIQVVIGIADGKLNKEIAWELHLGVGYIKVIVSNLLAKTGFTNRTALAVWWMRGGRIADRAAVAGG